MATLNNAYPTMADLALMPENAEAKDIINMLHQQNPFMEDAAIYPCNKGTKHKTTILTGLPQVFWGRVYKGIPATKGSRQSIEDTTGYIESAAQVDARIVDDFEKAEDKASIRLAESEGHIEAMSQEAARAVLYEDTKVNPDRITGLSPRFSSFSAENGKQIIDGGGTGNDLTSIWMITWGPDTVHLIYPNKGKAGIERNNQGKINIPDPQGNLYEVYRETFRWHLGVTVRDWRYVARVANIDTSDLNKDASGSSADLIELMTAMYYAHLGRRSAKGKTFIYANTTIVMYLDYQARNVPKNLFLTFKETGVNAKEVLHFRGIPVRESDGILDTEEEVV